MPLYTLLPHLLAYSKPLYLWNILLLTSLQKAQEKRAAKKQAEREKMQAQGPEALAKYEVESMLNNSSG